MKTIINIIFLILLTQTACTADQGTIDQAQLEELTFHSKVSNVRLNTLLTQKGKKLTDTVSTTVYGIKYNPPLEISTVESWQHLRKSPEEALTNYYRALSSAPFSDLLLFWHPDSREGIKNSWANPDRIVRVREYSKKRKSVKFHCVLNIEDSKVIIVEYQNRTQSLELKEIKGEWFLSNEPADDLKKSIIEGSFY